MNFFWRQLVIMLCLFSCFLKVFGQDSLEKQMTEEFMKASKFFQTDFDSTIHFLDKAIFYAKKISVKDAITLQLYKANFASNFYKLKEQKGYLDIAEAHFQKERHQLDSAELELEIALDIGIYQGNYFYKLGKFEKATEYFNKIVTALEQKPSLSWLEYQRLNKTLLYLGTINKKQGNYQPAIENFLRITAYDDECFAKHNKRTALDILPKHLAETYQFMGDFENAELYYQKVIDKNLKNKKINSRVNSYNAFAKFYTEKNRFDSARYYLTESLNIQKEDNPFQAETYQLLGESYRNKKDQKTARTFFEKALKSANSLYGNQHYKVAEINKAYGHSYEIEGNLETANKYYDTALNNLIPAYSNHNTNTVPKIKALYAPKVMLEILANKMRVLYQKKNEADSKNAYTAALQSMNIIDSLRLDYDSESSRQFLLNKSYPIFEQGIAICHSLYNATKEEQYLEQAFRMAEKSKAVLLLDALKNSNAEAFAGIPAEVLESGYQLRYKIKTLEDRLQKGKEKKKKPKQLSDISIQLFEARKDYKTYVSGLEKAHPKYYQLKYDLSTVTIDEIRQQLLHNAQTSLIEYFIGDQAIYRFNISNKEVAFDRIQADFPLHKWVGDLRNGITGNSATSATVFTTTAFKIYEKLLSNIALSEYLIIIPDGLLGYVPFDALLSAPVASDNARAFTEHPYLLKKHNISYCFSATLLKEMTSKNNQAEKPFLGFAPSFKSYSPLQSSREMTQALAKDYKGDFMADQQANKPSFIKEAGKYDILHISSHAVANDSLKDACYLVCSESNSNADYLIYNRDLYQLDLNASLVVLGACETGSGKLQRGEGIMSLARGFSYAGASSLLTTLWSVDEAATAGLLQSFYKQLQDGNTTNDALFSAKNAYLLNAQNEKEAHPRYWAALIPIGNMHAVNAGGMSLGWGLGFGILCLVLLFAGYKFTVS